MIKSKLISNLTILAVILIMTVPFVVSAQSGSGTQVNANNPLVNCNDVKSCDWNAFKEMINKVKDYALQLAVLVSVIFIVYAGGLYLTAAGDTGKIQTAHRILQNVVIGFFLASAGWLIVQAITKTLEVDKTFLPTGF
ncbi:MAG: pilin [Candidatus Paceibacterota bacterium]